MGEWHARRTKDVEVGIILRLRVKPRARGSIAAIDYSATCLDETQPDQAQYEHARPNVLTSEMQSTKMYHLGKPRLLPSVVVTVREME